jgi:hypothetical protein
MPLELLEPHRELATAFGERRWIIRDEPRTIEHWSATDSCQDVASLDHVEHFLKYDTSNYVVGECIGFLLNGIQCIEIGGDRGMLNLDRPLEMLNQIGQSMDRAPFVQ